jgi:hypothetical protein
MIVKDTPFIKKWIGLKSNFRIKFGRFNNPKQDSNQKAKQLRLWWVKTSENMFEGCMLSPSTGNGFLQSPVTNRTNQNKIEKYP